MSLIQVKFDNQLNQSEINIPLINSSKSESGSMYSRNQPEIQQTSVHGIQAPLIMVNNIVVDFPDIINFSLISSGVEPTVSMTFKDRNHLTSTIDSPGIDNELRVQILPKFEGIYKKINLTFYITYINIDRDKVSLSGKYKSSSLIMSRLMSFGEINTYNLFEDIARGTGLGFASNIESNDLDKRYIYCDNKSYFDILEEEINFSCIEDGICDYWIDFWNNLVLVDIKDRYNNDDPPESMKLWVAGQNKEVTEGSIIEPMEMDATLTNHPLLQSNELYVVNYRHINNPGSKTYSGTDRVYSIYENDKQEYFDHLIQDGDSKNDIFTKYSYLGETYGGYNYLLQRVKRSDFLQKINSNENIEVELNTPLLGIMRGNRVNFMWYINDDKYRYKLDNLKENGAASEFLVSPTNYNDAKEFGSDEGKYVLDESISGQYLITSLEIMFYDYQWKYKVRLSRPSINKPEIINEQL